MDPKIQFALAVIACVTAIVILATKIIEMAAAWKKHKTPNEITPTAATATAATRQRSSALRRVMRLIFIEQAGSVVTACGFLVIAVITAFSVGPLNRLSVFMLIFSLLGFYFDLAFMFYAVNSAIQSGESSRNDRNA